MQRLFHVQHLQLQELCMFKFCYLLKNYLAPFVFHRQFIIGATSLPEEWSNHWGDGCGLPANKAGSRRGNLPHAAKEGKNARAVHRRGQEVWLGEGLRPGGEGLCVSIDWYRRSIGDDFAARLRVLKIAMTRKAGAAVDLLKALVMDHFWSCMLGSDNELSIHNRMAYKTRK